ncbi:MAG: FAD/NAD(P)-binding protein [Candidatus Manganitrophaceae bacterium]
MNTLLQQHPLLPQQAEIVEKRREARGVYTYRLRLCDETIRRSYRFLPGQFNMVYLFGVGEVPISIVSDPSDPELLDHTIRIVGNVTDGLERLGKGEIIGLRGPYGSAWPLKEAEGKEVIIVTGGLGCAPVVSVINYIVQRRDAFGRLKILHGVKTPKDLLYRERFRAWKSIPNTEVYLTVDHPDRQWRYSVGVVTNLFSQIEVDLEKSLVMMCGPEIMMRYATRDLIGQGLSPERIYVSLERNMKCAVAFCGHCQLGPVFLCREGPVFRYDQVQKWIEKREL